MDINKLLKRSNYKRIVFEKTPTQEIIEKPISPDELPQGYQNQISIELLSASMHQHILLFTKGKEYKSGKFF